MSSRAFMIILFLIIECFNKESRKCRALTLEGGTLKGAYQVGALRAFVDYLLPLEYSYQSIVGVSVGSINANGFSFAQIGNESTSIDALENILLHLKLNQIFKNWDHGGIIHGLLFESGLVDTSPERKLIEVPYTYYGHHLFRAASYGATNVNEGKYHKSLNEMNDSNLIDWVMCSSAIAAFFPAQKCNNEYYIDGGTTYGIDLETPVQICRDLGYEDEDIIVDVMPLSTSEIIYTNCTQLNSLEMSWRARHIHEIVKKRHALQDSYYYYNKVKWRYLIGPNRTLPVEILGFIPLSTNPVKIRETYEIGYNDSLKIIKNISKSTF